MKRTTVYVGIGSNKGKRLSLINKGIYLLNKNPAIKISACSPLYETPPVGGPPQNLFLNGVIKVSTKISPIELLKVMAEIEKKMGRQRIVKWGPRTLDLDILTYGNSIIRRTKINIPHPRYHTRLFVLQPFSDLNPRFVHPQLKKSNLSLLRQLTGSGQRATIFACWKKSRYYRFKTKNPSENRSPR